MKRGLAWRVVLGGAVIVTALWAARPSIADEETAAGAQATPGSSAEQERIAHTFTDDTELKEFADIWDQRRLMLIRMTVLQEYWMEERDKLVALNKQIAERYKLDASKNYVFDPDRRALIEREVPPLVPGMQTPAGSPAAEPSVAP